MSRKTKEIVVLVIQKSGKIVQKLRLAHTASADGYLTTSVVLDTFNLDDW
jgi:hypothetical protein